MRSLRVLAAVAAIAGVGFASTALIATTPAPAQEGRDTVALAGHVLRCQKVRIVTDPRLPSEGAAAPGVLILNPRMLNQQPPTVRLFVFHHECGHHQIGDSELKADCWAVKQGVRDGWLDEKGLKQVCLSFEDAPETPTHPSGRRRCRNLDQCFVTAIASLPAGARQHASGPPPKLVSGPTLVSTGTLAYAASASPCPKPSARGPAEKDARANGCQ